MDLPFKDTIEDLKRRWKTRILKSLLRMIGRKVKSFVVLCVKLSDTQIFPLQKNHPKQSTGKTPNDAEPSSKNMLRRKTLIRWMLPIGLLSSWLTYSRRRSIHLFSLYLLPYWLLREECICSGKYQWRFCSSVKESIPRTYLHSGMVQGYVSQQLRSALSTLFVFPFHLQSASTTWWLTIWNRSLTNSQRNGASTRVMHNDGDWYE